MHLVLSFQTEMPGDPPGQPGPPPAPKVVAPKTIKCVRKVRVGANIDTSLETARADHLSLPQHPGTPSTTTKRVREEIITTSENSVQGKSPESPVTIRTQTVGGHGCVVCWVLDLNWWERDKNDAAASLRWWCGKIWFFTLANDASIPLMFLFFSLRSNLRVWHQITECDLSRISGL